MPKPKPNNKITDEIMEDVLRRWEYSEQHQGFISKRRGKRPTKVSGGYGVIVVKGKRYREHRLVYYYHRRRQPKMLDHIDQDRRNDSIKNLRATTHSRNLRNCKLEKSCWWSKQAKQYRMELRLGNHSKLKAVHAKTEAECRAKCIILGLANKYSLRHLAGVSKETQLPPDIRRWLRYHRKGKPIQLDLPLEIS